MKKIDITEKKINYKVADIIFLLALFVILIPFQKYAFRIVRSNSDTILVAIGISLAFSSLYIQRFFFRPRHEEIVSLRQKGWKITGYYSKRSLKNEEIYIKSYNSWIKFGIIFLLLELSGFLVVYILNGCFLNNNMLVAHIVILCIIQVVPWILTMIREKEYEKN